jgi:hypothetical protein
MRNIIPGLDSMISTSWGFQKQATADTRKSRVDFKISVAIIRTRILLIMFLLEADLVLRK